MLITAAVFAIAAVPLFLFVKERAAPRSIEKAEVKRLAAESLREVARTMKSLARICDIGHLAYSGYC